ncbi:MAG TPA: siderophore-interacting protein, partial [Polyangiaceae bacterium]
MLASEASSPIDLTPQRVRHAIVPRPVTVAAVTTLSPAFRSVRFVGESLAGFTSLGFDDHVKLVVPPHVDGDLVMPPPGEGRIAFPRGAIVRDYTPRSYSNGERWLDVEFSLHENGPMADWARAAKPGAKAILGGPKGSMVVPLGYDWHLFLGDESAMPAIARRLEELPANAKAIAVIETRSADDRRSFATKALLDLRWVDIGASDLLATIASTLTLPKGNGYAWAAGESAAMKLVREAFRARSEIVSE